MKNVNEFEKLAKGTKDKILSFGITSKTVLKNFDRCVSLLNKYLDDHQLEFNLEIGLKWLDQQEFTATNTNTYNNNLRLSYRRTILLLWDNKCSNLTEWKIYPSIKQTFPTTEEFKNTLHNYRKFLEQSLYAQATIDFRIQCAKPLLIFMESKQVYLLQGITHALIAEYFTTDHFSNRKPAGVQSEATRAKLFLRYLEEENLVEDQTLHYAVPIYYTQQEKIITTITLEAEKQLLGDYPHLLSNKREKAMFLLALRLGLRTTDIFNLKFENIDWERSTLSILQQKTSRFLKLKIDNETQNALIDYILNERRQTSTAFIFITAKGPIKKQSGNSVRDLYKRISDLDKQKHIPHQGLHILRRTFASRLLNNRTPLAVISGALGHTDKNQVHKYLATDEEKMRLCALSLTSIPFGVSFDA